MFLSPFQFQGCEDTLLRKHLDNVLDGEYSSHDLVKFLGPTPRILDLGANIGAFSYWACFAFTKPKIYAYEPIVRNVDFYRQNMREAGIPQTVAIITQAAVYPGEGDKIRIFTSPINAGMNSAFSNMTGGTEEQYQDVPRVDPAELPIVDFVKVDTEGAELAILREYLKTHPLPKAISFEFHNRYDRYELENLLGDDYILHTAKIDYSDLGVMNFLRNDFHAQ